MIMFGVSEGLSMSELINIWHHLVTAETKWAGLFYINLYCSAVSQQLNRPNNTYGNVLEKLKDYSTILYYPIGNIPTKFKTRGLNGLLRLILF